MLNIKRANRLPNAIQPINRHASMPDSPHSTELSEFDNDYLQETDRLSSVDDKIRNEIEKRYQSSVTNDSYSFLRQKPQPRHNSQASLKPQSRSGSNTKRRLVNKASSPDVRENFPMRPNQQRQRPLEFLGKANIANKNISNKSFDNQKIRKVQQQSQDIIRTVSRSGLRPTRSKHTRAISQEAILGLGGRGSPWQLSGNERYARAVNLSSERVKVKMPINSYREPPIKLNPVFKPSPPTKQNLHIKQNHSINGLLAQKHAMKVPSNRSIDNLHVPRIRYK